MVVEHVEPEARNPKRHDQQAKSPFLPRGYVEAHQEMAETLSQSGPDRVPPRATLHAGRTRFSHIASFPMKLASPLQRERRCRPTPRPTTREVGMGKAARGINVRAGGRGCQGRCPCRVNKLDGRRADRTGLATIGDGRGARLLRSVLGLASGVRMGSHHPVCASAGLPMRGAHDQHRRHWP